MTEFHKVMSNRELETAIQFLREQYERAKKIDFIHNPLAWALYQTWRHVDEPPKEGKHGKGYIM